jgi:hypothetical protein
MRVIRIGGAFGDLTLLNSLSLLAQQALKLVKAEVPPRYALFDPLLCVGKTFGVGPD